MRLGTADTAPPGPVQGLEPLRRFYRNVAASTEHSDMTHRQAAVMLYVYSVSEPLEVKDLAQVLGVVKPVITRALNTLSGKGLLRRGKIDWDRRRVLVLRTAEGTEWIMQLLRCKAP